MREKLVAKLELLQKEREVTIGNVNAYNGAIQVVQALITELDAESSSKLSIVPPPSTESTT